MEPRALESFALNLPELEIFDVEEASSATKRVPISFRRFYPDLADRADRETREKKDLYSVDSVEPRDRFSSIVRLSVRAQSSRPTAGEADLTIWRPDHEQEDRPEILRAVTSFVDNLKTVRRSDDEHAYQVLLELAPEFLKEFGRKDGLAVERFYRDALGRIGEVRADRKTVPVLGSLLLPYNRERLFAALDYGLRERPSAKPRFLIWLPAQVPYWGATTLLGVTVEALQAKISAEYVDPYEEEIPCVGLCFGSPERYLERAFDHVVALSRRLFPAALEVLIVPRVCGAIVVHAPIGAQSGHAVPLGIVSFDQKVLSRAHELLRSNIGTAVEPSGRDEQLINRELSAEIEDMLEET